MIADLTGHVALVTGAGSGIGRAVVRCFVEQGAVVEATDIDGAAIDALVADFGAERVHGSRLDVTAVDDVRTVVDAAVARHGRLDVLVASAGVVLADDSPSGRDPAADWDRCFAVNVRGTVHACEAALAHMRPRHSGAIVTIGSISAHSARATVGAYPASKAAALRYTKGLALQVAPHVRVNAVCPGAVWTGMQARILAESRRARIARTSGTAATVPTPQDDDERTFFAPYEAITPLRRPQTVDDVAKAVAFLASPDASNITGQCLHVDGGAVIRD